MNKQLFIIATILFVAALAMSAKAENACYPSIHDVPVSCTGGTITSDTGNHDDCRYITCEGQGEVMVVKACEKPDHPPKSDFSMYRLSPDPNNMSVKLKICLDDTCIKANGYAKSPANTICKPTSHDDDDEDDDDEPSDNETQTNETDSNNSSSNGGSSRDSSNDYNSMKHQWVIKSETEFCGWHFLNGSTDFEKCDEFYLTAFKRTIQHHYDDESNTWYDEVIDYENLTMSTVIPEDQLDCTQKAAWKRYNNPWGLVFDEDIFTPDICQPLVISDEMSEKLKAQADAFLKMVQWQGNSSAAGINWTSTGFDDAVGWKTFVNGSVQTNGCLDVAGDSYGC